MTNNLAYKPFGDSAILIEWKAEISNTILEDMLQFKKAIFHHKKKLIYDVVVGYHSITIVYKFGFKSYVEEVNSLKSIYLESLEKIKVENFLWEIPVCYDLEFGIDLKEISTSNRISTSEIIQLHTQPIYTVFFIGFLPGFPYLSGLNSKLFLDRKSIPRLKVPKGAVGIGGKQTGIYPQEIAGGWNIIGNSPIELFNVSKENPCLLSSGDQLKFESISKNEYFDIKNELEKGNSSITKNITHD